MQYFKRVLVICSRALGSAMISKIASISAGKGWCKSICGRKFSVGLVLSNNVLRRDTSRDLWDAVELAHCLLGSSSTRPLTCRAIWRVLHVYDLSLLQYCLDLPRYPLRTDNVDRRETWACP